MSEEKYVAAGKKALKELRPYNPHNRHDVYAVYSTARALFDIVNIMGNPERYLHEDFYHVWKRISGSENRRRIEELMQDQGDNAFREAVSERLEIIRRSSWEEYYRATDDRSPQTR